MFKGRREILFVYSVKDGNPNGDPLNANYPRYDEETQQVLASDVRIKRTIRDQLIRENEAVFIDGEPKTLKARFEELKKQLNTSTGRETMEKCIDARLFGVTFALGNESFSWTGPVQFKWARSLNKVKVDFVQGTGGFATSDNSENRTFRNEYKVPFAIMAVYAIANQNASKATGAAEDDLDKMKNALWNGTNNLITRSKMEHRSRMMIEIEYKEGFESRIGSLDEKIKLIKDDGTPLSEEEQLAIRTPKDFVLDISELAMDINKIKDKIEHVRVNINEEMKFKGLESLETLGEIVSIEKR
ncbi:type I-B CRISPR-associated protein Cas7/Csh2 [Mesoaciditoga lauensis]|uniref:type I-B CRISPR-associated protein Cas7/Csh2 n=1 Tax=Mesoaciditoga lauensis TaxID=1495039 RepID=UPI00056CFFF3|nr:type I-B CRISPR-associated protein Cas7/Csh2 [Mesoaciditoga lauensis]